MNQEQVFSLLRTLLQVGGSVLATRLGIDGAAWESFSAALLVVATTAWGIYARRKAGIVAAAAALPEVRAIEAAPSLASAVKAPNVQASPLR